MLITIKSDQMCYSTSEEFSKWKLSDDLSLWLDQTISLHLLTKRDEWMIRFLVNIVCIMYALLDILPCFFVKGYSKSLSGPKRNKKWKKKWFDFEIKDKTWRDKQKNGTEGTGLKKQRQSGVWLELYNQFCWSSGLVCCLVCWSQAGHLHSRRAHKSCHMAERTDSASILAPTKPCSMWPTLLAQHKRMLKVSLFKRGHPHTGAERKRGHFPSYNIVKMFCF